MKRTAIALTGIIIFTLLFWTQLGQIADAQFDGLPYEPPVVTILSPSANGTYNVADVPLNVTVQINGFIYNNIETIKWLNYSLDGQTAIPMTLIVPANLSPGYYVDGNDNLIGLSDGTHNLTIYGETAVSGLSGNFNETIFFTVDTTTTSVVELPFSTLPVLAVSVAVVVVFAGLLIYLKKRKSKVG